jgi:signal transduction histidine kinase/DNA-binding response OmpR family regulator/ligand-binding sensor domain-containing protein
MAQSSPRAAGGWQELTIADGLSQGMIFDLKQDRKGFIWIATKDGLNRYDGHNFRVFTHDPYNRFSLSDNVCSALLIDSRWRLWVGTLTQGLNLFDERTQRFYHIDISDQGIPNAGNDEVWGLAEDPGGNIWVSTNQAKLFKIRLPESLKTGFPTTENFTAQTHLTRLVLPGQPASGAVAEFRFNANGNALLQSSAGQFVFNWQQPTGSRAIAPFSTDWTRAILTNQQTRSGYWFTATDAAIHGWQRGVHRVIPLPKQAKPRQLVQFVDANLMAVATTDYLWLMSPAELMGQDSLTSRNAAVPMAADVQRVRVVLRDNTGNIWIGTGGYGLRVFNPRVRQFKGYFPKRSLSYLYQDRQGRSYGSYEQQFWQLDRATDQLSPLLAGQPDRPSWQLMQDSHDHFWVASTDRQTGRPVLLNYSVDWRLLHEYPMPAHTALGLYGNQIKADKAGNIWIGATNGQLLKFDPVAETFRQFSYQHLLPRSGAAIETYALYFDGAGTLWIGTQKGLIRADHPLTDPVFTLFKNSRTNRQSLSNDFVSCVLDDPNQPDRYLWVSTKGGGLERLDKQTQQFRHFTEAQGLPNKVVYGILADEFNNLWLSTNRGLAQFNPKTFAFHNYTKADGLQDNEFNTGSFFKTTSGELLFGGVNGLTAFRAGEVMRKAGPVPQAHIIGLNVNNEPTSVGGPDGILPRSIENTSHIRLAHNQNLITLEFGLMDYTNTAKNRFRYRLEGIDANWVNAGTNRFANYAQLPDGDYTLQMEGSADGDAWSKPVELQIRVLPPLYRTWWAYLLYALVLLVIGGLVYRFQTQRLLLEQQLTFEHKEASRLAELDALKTRFFANISHEFRTPLTLILGPIEQAVSDYAGDTRFPMVQRHANRLLGLINQLLDLSKLEAGQLKPEPEPGDLAAFLRTLTSSFSSLAESRRIRFTVSQTESVYLTRFDADKLEKIVTNLLANALKFTPAGNEVSVRVQYPRPGTAGSMQLTVQDTGVGIAPDKLPHIFERFYQGGADGPDPGIDWSYEGTGIGLSLVQELVQVLGGSIGVDSTVGVGTTFTVSLPLLVGVDEDSFNPATLLPNILKGVSDPAALVPFGGVEGSPSSSQEETLAENILLIIDDNADIRQYVRSVFEPDYRVVEAQDGQEGLEKAGTLMPDIVICDLMMPRLDGFGFCRALKSQEATSHIPVVMLTARATVENRIEGFGLGADEYLTKPFHRAEIKARVRNLITQRQRLRQYFSQPLAQTRIAPSNDEHLLVREDAFLQKARAVVEQHLSESRFGVEELSQALNISPRQVVRKLKALTNQTAVEFIRTLRLERAAERLQQQQGSIAEIAYAVGFEKPSYFARVFEEQYGVLPSAYGQSDEAG